MTDSEQSLRKKAGKATPETKLVPRKITHKMRVAGVNTQLPGIGEPPLYEKIYHAMYDAAPPVTDQKDAEIAAAYARGAADMRERAAKLCDANDHIIGADMLADAIRAIPSQPKEKA